MLSVKDTLNKKGGEIMSPERRRPIKPNEIKPIDQKDIAERKLNSLPDQAIAAFNELIAERYRGGEAVVRQDEVVRRMRDKGLTEKDIYGKGCLDVDAVYEQEGWKVKYDRPVHYGGEDFEPYFTFRRTRRKLK